MHKVWKRCPRYEKKTQGMKNVPKVWKMCPRYETDPQSYKMRFQAWKRSFLEKQWFFIPLWVYFIPFWVWKKSLFFPDAHIHAHTLNEWLNGWCSLSGQSYVSSKEAREGKTVGDYPAPNDSLLALPHSLRRSISPKPEILNSKPENLNANP
jgi:hypothetical protein